MGQILLKHLILMKRANVPLLQELYRQLNIVGKVDSIKFELQIAQAFKDKTHNRKK